MPDNIVVDPTFQRILALLMTLVIRQHGTSLSTLSSSNWAYDELGSSPIVSCWTIDT